MYATPSEASKHYGVSENALRMWANEGRIKYIKTKGGHRRYILQDPEEQRREAKESTGKSIIYTRVSSRKQKDDLERQSEYLSQKYPKHTIITDIGSGINFERKGFKGIFGRLIQRKYQRSCGCPQRPL